MSPFGGSGVPVFPLPAFSLRFTNSHSRRVQQRYSRGLSATLLANRCISALNKLNVSYSSLQSSPSPITTRTSQRILDNIYNLSSRFVSRQANIPSRDHGVFFNSPFEYSGGSFTPIVPLQADKVSLPSVAGTVSLVDLLPPDLSSVYNDPQQLLLSSPRLGRRPRVRMDVAPSEYIKLILRMMPLGMLHFTTQPKVVNGLFATPKPDGAQRLIINARPGNHVFVDPPHVTLPTPDVTARLSVPPGSKLYVGKVDIDNFYHRLLLPEWMWPYFALPAVSSSAIGLPGPDRLVYPCCRTLPMGWSHSVFVAQAAHEHFLTTKAGFSPSDFLTSISDSNLDRTRLQVYIDDALFFGLDRAHVAACQDRYIAALTAIDLPPKQSKVVQPTCAPVECIGLEVDGVNLTIGLAVPKLCNLIDLTRSFLARGECSGAELSHLVGKWTWAAMACRSSLSVFSAVYTFINKSCFNVFSLWPSVRRELTTMIDLAPLLHSSLGFRIQDSGFISTLLQLENRQCPQRIKNDINSSSLMLLVAHVECTTPFE